MVGVVNCDAWGGNMQQETWRWERGVTYRGRGTYGEGERDIQSEGDMWWVIVMYGGGDTQGEGRCIGTHRERGDA